MDVVFQLGQASVSEIRDAIEDAPSYSSVRTLVRLLEEKGFLKHHRDGTKYVYRSTQTKDRASRSALQHLIATFFGGSHSDAMAAILGDRKADFSPEELDQLEDLIEKTRQEKKS